MKRIIFDVPRWSVYLHRQSRGLDSADVDDVPRRQFEDELFERLYAGAAEELPEEQKHATLRPWAERVHAACDQLPSFARLQAECRGDADAAAVAVEALTAEIEPLIADTPDAQRLRRAIRTACEKASVVVEELRETTEALEHVTFGRAHGSGSVAGEERSCPSSRALTRRIRDDRRLQRIALLAGRFKRIAAIKQRQKVKHGADEIADVEQGADLGRLLPAELGKLVHPRLRLAALRDLVEQQSIQYKLSGAAALGKGPLVACLDKSGSMDGKADEWATAVALALLDVVHREGRPFALLCFDSAIKYETFVEIGGDLPEQGLFVSCGGGTDIGRVTSRSLDIIEQHPGALRKADIVIITDGASSTDSAESLKIRAASLGVTTLGFGIGVEADSLRPWCDEVHAVTDLDHVDERSANALFAR